MRLREEWDGDLNKALVEYYRATKVPGFEQEEEEDEVKPADDDTKEQQTTPQVGCSVLDPFTTSLHSTNDSYLPLVLCKGIVIVAF